MLGYQHHGDSHENFICDRVKESTKPGTLVPAACQKTIEPVSQRRDAENERGGKWRPGDRQIKTNTKNGIRMTRNSVSNVGILNCIMTGNYLLSVRLPLCCYRDINVSTTRRSFLPDLAKYPALLQFPRRWRYVNLANRPYISTTFADVLARRLQWFPGNWYF